MHPEQESVPAATYPKSGGGVTLGSAVETRKWRFEITCG